VQRCILASDVGNEWKTRYGLPVLLQCVNARDVAGQTALHKAAMNGRIDCIHLLLDYGVDVNSIDHSGDDVIILRLLAHDITIIEPGT